MKEYREIRKKASILDICHSPELACEVTLQPVNRFEIDAAILFADILLPFEPLGLGLSFPEGRGGGPVIDRPILVPADVDRLPDVSPGDMQYVLDAVSLIKKELAGRVPLIGFAGAPFTLASYAIEGGSSRSFIETKRFMYSTPEAWHSLLGTFAEMVGNYLVAQVEAGADALQLFDSWVGILSQHDYERFVAPHSKRAIEIAKSASVPVIHFGTNTRELLGSMAQAGGDVIGVDWRTPIDEAWKEFPERGVQGNLDPTALFAPQDELRAQVRDIMERVGGRAGHIFNLGHGVLPPTEPDALDRVIDYVREGA